MRAALEQIVPEFAIQQIQPPGTLDGGDICEAGEHYFIGLSERTNETGAEQLAQFVTAHGYTASSIDIRRLGARTSSSAVTSREYPPLLHLKSGLACLGAIVWLSRMRLPVGKSSPNLILFVVRPVRTSMRQTASRLTIMCWSRPATMILQQTLRSLGYQTIALDMSEFQKMDGGLSCLSLRW